jgi:thiol-disulfide isomerase/thioredoxin
LWESGKIPQRVYALNYLVRQGGNDPALWQVVRPLVLAAAGVADSEMQALALQLFFNHKDERLVPAAAAMTASADPVVRIEGLMRVNDQNDKRWAHLDAALLQDSDSKVRIIAAAGLRELTGEDFGVRLSADPSVNTAGLGKWKQWWTENASTFPAAPPVERLPCDSPGAAFPFSLPDLTGRTIALSDYKGKVVLLNFWATWCPSCVEELQDLGDLQRSHPNDLAILGINLDGVSEGHDHDSHEGHDHAEDRAAIEKAVRDSKIGYPTLLDPQGTTLGPYGAGALPVSVLIGRDGTVKRRLLGARTHVAWDAMIAEAGSR